MQNKKKVLFFVQNLNSGGIENYLLRFLRKYGAVIDPIVICKSGKTGVLAEEYIKLGISVVPINFLSFKGFVKIFKLLGTNVETVVDFTGNFSGSILFLAFLKGVKKRIVFYRGSANKFKPSAIKNLANFVLNKFTYSFSTKILSNSKSALDYFFATKIKNSSKFQVIYNGIDYNEFVSTNDNLRATLNIPADAFVIGHVGRYHPSKNHDTIFKVFLQLSKTYSNMYFIMCGKDVPGAFEAIKNKEGVANLILLENTKEPIKVYNTLNCFYFPSLTEGQPNALIEAMVLGIPFVASNISPILETVPESYHEQLVSPMDSMGTCEKIIEIYLKKPEFNIAEIARDKFNSKILFEHFYQNL